MYVCQHDSCVYMSSEAAHLQFAHYIILHPAQLLGLVSGSQETKQDVLLLALRDELEGTVEGDRQILQRITHRLVLHRLRLLVELLEESADPGHARLDATALLLILLNRLHSLFDLQRQIDDLPHAAQCYISHRVLAPLMR